LPDKVSGSERSPVNPGPAHPSTVSSDVPSPLPSWLGSSPLVELEAAIVEAGSSEVIATGSHELHAVSGTVLDPACDESLGGDESLGCDEPLGDAVGVTDGGNELPTLDVPPRLAVGSPFDEVADDPVPGELAAPGTDALSHATRPTTSAALMTPNREHDEFTSTSCPSSALRSSRSRAVSQIGRSGLSRGNQDVDP